MSGFGFYRFADGKTYIGYYLADRKHGYGIFTWLDGK
jgi:MORN repeat